MEIQQHLFLVSSLIGFLIALALLSRIFTKNKGDFFIGIVVLTLAIELFFSWGAQSGINNTPGIFPYWMLLNYLLLPPSIWLFIKYQTDDNFRFQPWHLWLFLPALVAYTLDVWSKMASISLMSHKLWIWFTEYVPLIGLVFVLGFFWVKYYKFRALKNFKSQKNSLLTQFRFLMLMSSLTFVCLTWLLFEFIGFKHYEIIEYTFIILFLGLAFFNFLENQTFPPLALEERNREFPNYDDQDNLVLLERTMHESKPYLNPNIPLKNLALELNLPARYVSFLINQYHHKNYKEYINAYRIDAFLEKVKNGENKTKTLLGLAMECGFSSKSTFNQVFKNHMGKSPSEYIG